jgi:hypothetical protein
VRAPQTRPRVRRCVRARVGVGLGAQVSAPKTCEPSPSARTACGSARRRSTRRWCSTRTSARGTPRRSPRCPRYAPLSAPGGAPPRRDALGLSSMRRGCCARRHRRCARLCTHTRIGTLRSRAAYTAMHMFMHMFNSRSSLHIIAHSICSYMVIFIENRPKYGSPLVHAVHACACVWPRVAVCARMGLCRHVSLCMNSYRWVRCIVYIEVYTSAGV